MVYHILVITTNYLKQYVKDTLGEPSEKIEFRFVEYGSFAELKDIYKEHENWADGILTTGTVIKRVIEIAVSGPLKPILSMDADNESFYRVPLSLMVEHRYLDPERVIFDVFVNSEPHPSILRLLENQNIADAFPAFARWLSTATLEELYRIEEETLEHILRLWNESRIDLVICRYSSLVPRLKELGIPCVYANSTDQYILSILNQLLSQIKIAKITAHAPAVISILPEDPGAPAWSKRQRESLKRTALSFAKKNDLNLIFQDNDEEFIIVTEKLVISYLTCGFRENSLKNHLEQDLDLKLSISYGIGNSVTDALNNAASARATSGISGSSYIVDEELRLVGPLDPGETSLSARFLDERTDAIARRASLSRMTIHRLSRLMILRGQRELTSNDLADSFHISLRGANRILQKLEATGLATVIFRKSSHMKGRPTKVYRIDLDQRLSEI